MYGVDGMAARRHRRRAQKRRRDHGSSPEQSAQPVAPSQDFHLADRVERLVYTRRQAAEALGVSIATLDRRIAPALNTVKTPWGTRLIPIRELERFLERHAEAASAEFLPRRRAGRHPSVAPAVVERIRHERHADKGLAEIARGLTADGVPTAHGGRRWWPSTVRSILLRSHGTDRRPSGVDEMVGETRAPT